MNADNLNDVVAFFDKLILEGVAELSDDDEQSKLFMCIDFAIRMNMIQLVHELFFHLDKCVLLTEFLKNEDTTARRYFTLVESIPEENFEEVAYDLCMYVLTFIIDKTSVYKFSEYFNEAGYRALFSSLCMLIVKLEQLHQQSLQVMEILQNSRNESVKNWPEQLILGLCRDKGENYYTFFIQRLVKGEGYVGEETIEEPIDIGTTKNLRQLAFNASRIDAHFIKFCDTILKKPPQYKQYVEVIINPKTYHK